MTEQEAQQRRLVEVIAELLNDEADMLTERIRERTVRGPYEPDEFQEQCLRTWRAEGQTHQQQVIHALLGLVGEAGETADLLKKHFFKPGRSASAGAVMDELADVLYYVAVLAHLWGFTFEDMQAHLADKLADGHGWVADAAGGGER
jgi:NTP pyrophosphatase (non-canonical NTP hydrolase)